MTPLIAGNWKMNGTAASARALASAVAQAAGKSKGARAAVFPPFTHLALVAEALKGSPVALGAQDCSWEKSGAFTGEVSCDMLKEAGCAMVLVGHSERRHVLGETDEVVARKLRAALDSGLEAVLCVGETLAQREGGQTASVLKSQTQAALQGLKDLSRVVLAYEPVWAIGTGKVATPAQAREAHGLIREVPAAKALPILYGGSVKPDNLASLLAEPGVDGALVGGASLDAAGFSKMLELASLRSKENSR